MSYSTNIKTKNTGLTISRWQTVRVFISSTFRDMQAERDYLARFVFPRLREELLRRYINFKEVDLRWGLTSGHDILGVCRDIIDECRPRFLCLLGGRYGWVPSGQERSITAEEVQYAVMDRLEEKGYAYFYFRDPVITAKLDELNPGHFQEPTGSVAEKKLAELKEAIRTAQLDPRNYTARIDPKQRRLIGFENLGNQIYSDLLASVEDEFGSVAPVTVDEFTGEKAEMESFMAERVDGYFAGSRESILEKLTNFIQSSGLPNIFLLTGAPGSGKSSLLAKFLERLSDFQFPHSRPPLVIFHFISVSPNSNRIRHTMRRLCHELCATLGIHDELPDDLCQLIEKFQNLLAKAASDRHLILLIDGLNLFDPEDNPHLLRWFPSELPRTVRIILSTAIKSAKGLAAEAGPLFKALRMKGEQLLEIRLEPLDRTDALSIIEAFLTRYQKRLTPEQQDAILAKRDSGNPLYLRVILEELRTFGIYEEVLKRITESPDNVKALFRWILSVRLSKDLAFRDGVGNLIGSQLVRQVVSLLSVSQYGLSQSELVALVDPGDPQGNVTTLLRLLRPYLMHRGELIAFYHDEFRAAVKSEYLAKESDQVAVHRVLASYFFHQADSKGDNSWKGATARALKELPHHAYEGHLYHILFTIASDMRFLELQAKAFPNDLRQPLETLQKAIHAAAAVNEAGKMTKFSLRHADWLISIRRRSPLSVVIEGDITRAWDLADTADPYRSALWYLLLAWELKDADRYNEAIDTVKKLADKNLPQLAEEWMEAIAAKAFSEFACIADENYFEAASKLIKTQGSQLCELLCDKGFEDIALQTARRFADAFSRSKALSTIAIAYAKANDFAQAQTITKETNNSQWQIETLCSIAAIHVETGDNDRVLRNFARALKIASYIDLPELRSKAFQEIAASTATAGHHSDAVHTFDQALTAAKDIKYSKEKRDTAIRNISIAQARSGDFDGAFSTAKHIYRSGRLAEAYRDIAAAQAEAGDLIGAMRTAKKIPYDSDRSWALSSIAIVQARSGDVVEALKTTKQIYRAEPQDHADVTIAAAQVLAGDVADAQFTARYISDTRKRIEAYCEIVAVLVEAGEAARGLNIADEIEEKEVKANVLCKIAADLSKREDYDGAQRTLSRAITVADEIKGVWSRDHSFQNIATNLASAGETVKAFASLVNISCPDVRTRALLAIANLHKRAVNHGRVRKALAQMLIGFNPTYYINRAEALYTIANVQSEVGDQGAARRTFNQAISTAESIGELKQRFRILENIAISQAKMGDFAWGIITAEKIKDTQQYAYTLSAISLAQTQAGDYTGAPQTFAKALTAWQDCSSAWYRYEDILKILADIPVQGGKLTQVLMDIVENIEKIENRDEVFKAIATAQARAGHVDRGIFIAEKIEDTRRYVHTLCDIALSQAEKGCASEASHTFDRAVGTTTRHAYHWREEIHYVVAIAQAQAGYIQEAMTTAKKVRDDFERDKVQVAIATALTQVGELYKAMTLANGLRSSYYRDKVLKAIATAQVQAGDLTQAMTTTAEIRTAQERTEALCAIATAQAKAGDIAQAMKIANEVYDADGRDSILCGISTAQAQAGDLNRAITTAKEINGWRRDDALQAITIAAASSKQSYEEIYLLYRYLESGELDVAPIADVLARDGDKRRVLKLLIPCANNLNSTFKMCGVLAKLYPLQSTKISRVIQKPMGLAGLEPD